MRADQNSPLETTLEIEAKWPVGQVVKTVASHAINIGSNPVRVTSTSQGAARSGKIALDKCRKRGIMKKLTGDTGRCRPETNIVGVDCDEGPPVPIPNTEVKLICADNTWWVTAREDR